MLWPVGTVVGQTAQSSQEVGCSPSWHDASICFSFLAYQPALLRLESCFGIWLTSLWASTLSPAGAMAICFLGTNRDPTLSAWFPLFYQCPEVIWMPTVKCMLGCVDL